jgi:MFS family permease
MAALHAWFFGIFSAALLLSGMLRPLAGPMIDEHGVRDVLAVTNFVFAAGLVCLSFASGIASLASAWAVCVSGGPGRKDVTIDTAGGAHCVRHLPAGLSGQLTNFVSE